MDLRVSTIPGPPIQFRTRRTLAGNTPDLATSFNNNSNRPYSVVRRQRAKSIVQDPVIRQPERCNRRRHSSRISGNSRIVDRPSNQATLPFLECGRTACQPVRPAQSTDPWHNRHFRQEHQPITRTAHVPFTAAVR